MFQFKNDIENSSFFGMCDVGRARSVDITRPFSVSFRFHGYTSASLVTEVFDSAHVLPTAFSPARGHQDRRHQIVCGWSRLNSIFFFLM